MITADDLAIWKQFPKAVFTLYSAGTTPEAKQRKNFGWVRSSYRPIPAIREKASSDLVGSRTDEI
jgi:hypothetical protein